jgi:hypothetical protein
VLGASSNEHASKEGEGIKRSPLVMSAQVYVACQVCTIGFDSLWLCEASFGTSNHLFLYLESKFGTTSRVEQCCNFLAGSPSQKCFLWLVDRRIISPFHSAYLSNSTTIGVSLAFHRMPAVHSHRFQWLGSCMAVLDPSVHFI